MNDRQEKYQSSALLNSVYDINRALLRSQPTPNSSQEVRIHESGGKKEEQTPSRRRKFFGRVSGIEFYCALIRTNVIPIFTNAQSS
ncbi:MULTISPECIES: hypothetical protein [Okeania]|uniref:hypothetical protein n=1 Tax=Okeania TaxID=1458928 RepID=UPI000F539030|nr:MULTISPECIES: hypothetical protein [Okeania]NET13987.1 hypothetical protein [Okeania sp. SIO1H6]NES77628.1 hypothetical protein [Okeania sp. SIO1H4]NES88180.1 hypothetical protein [Okeania sp. SIO2B9]NET21256.1 hypothetical protein [Okeania sp. SIO1H5]NET75094.1 hypothetical protein [Okeania sp. SIO1F9]